MITVYRAFLLNKDTAAESITLHAKEIEVFGSLINGVKVYFTPFEAIEALYEENKKSITPAHRIVIHKTEIDEDSYITISNNKEEIHICKKDLFFIKSTEESFGTVISYLSERQRGN